MVTPNSRLMRAMVSGWWVMMRKRVSVSLAISSISRQKRSTLASSSGASTSSSTQIGEGLVRNTAKMSASAVNAFSPPDSSVSASSRLPGGPELGGAAAEQRLEQAAEMAVDRIEGFEQPLAALAVQIGDALAEPRNSLLNVGLLALHLFELGGKLRLFLLGC